MGGVTAALLVPAQAAAPATGSVSDAATSTSWSGGPFVVPNTTGLAGAVTCGAATPCDDFALTVATSAGYGTTHSLRISVQWPVAAADFDVYLLDSAGTEVAAAASSSDPEVILTAPTSGKYTVRVVPFAPAGQSYTATASLVTTPVNPPAGTQTPPGYGTYPAPESFKAAHDAGEPSIGANPATGAALYQAYLSTAKVTFNDTVTPATATWVDRSATALKGCPQGSTTSLDPILYTDRVTGRTFESQLAGKAALTCYTDDDGQTWKPSQGSGINSGVDHQTMGGGPFAPTLGGDVHTYPNAVYYCSQDIADAMCALSRDGGVTFGPSVPIYNLLDCGGLHGHVMVAPDGTVYVPNKGCGGNQAVAVSEDNGLTWSVRKVPGSTPGDTDPSVGIGANGTVYFGYQNSDGHARVAVSRDKGLTWQDDQDVGVPFGLQNVVFPAVIAGDDDRAAFTYLGTPTGGNYQDTAFTGVWHTYVSTTYDGGKSWVTTDSTPTDPVQKGSICTAGTTCGQNRNLLDFIAITVDGQGRPLVGYADGCTGACVTGGPQNFDALATIARQTTGLRLFSAYDPAPDLTVTGLSTSSPKGGAVRSRATVANIGSAVATGVVVRTTVDGGQAVSSAPVTLAPGQSVSITLNSPGKATKGVHTVTAVVDPANVVAEPDEGNNRQSATVTVK